MVRATEAVLGAYARALAHISRGYALQVTGNSPWDSNRGPLGKTSGITQ